MRPPCAPCRIAALTSLSFLSTLVGTQAAAAPGTATGVQGVVVPPATVEAPPSQLLGFLPPIENPIVELRQCLAWTPLG